MIVLIFWTEDCESKSKLFSQFLVLETPFEKVYFSEKPEFTKIPSETYKVKLGDEIRMRCEAQGYPPPRIEWQREGYDRVLSYDNTLLIDKADYSSTGVYICRAVVNNMYIVESRAQVNVFGKNDHKNEWTYSILKWFNTSQFLKSVLLSCKNAFLHGIILSKRFQDTWLDR